MANKLVRTDSGDCSLSVLDGGVLKVGFIDGGNARDFPITLDGGTLGTSAFGTAMPWVPAVGPVIVGTDGAVFDTSAGDANQSALSGDMRHAHSGECHTGCLRADSAARKGMV